jgi:hypothetical protein
MTDCRERGDSLNEIIMGDDNVYYYGFHLGRLRNDSIKCASEV